MVVEAIAGASLEAEIAQPGQRIAFGIGAAGGKRLLAVVVAMQQAPFFHAEQKDQPIDETQELLEIGVLAEFAGVESGAQRLIAGVL
ncbi:hypothetical protein [Methylocaldum sp. GT1BB]